MSNNSNSNRAPKKFTTTPPPGAVSPVGLRFSSNSDYENISTVRGNSSNNGLSQLSEFNRDEEFELPESEGSSNGVLNNLSVWSNNNSKSNNSTGLPEYFTTNRTSNNNQFPRITAKNMKEYPELGGNIFSNKKTSNKPGKRNNGKSRKSGKSGKARKSKNTRKTKKNRK